MAFSRGEYENLLYTLPSRYPQITTCTLRLYGNSATTAFVRGVVRFQNHYHQEPNIKQHRLPAHDVTSTAPNLPTLIADCLALGQSV